MGFGQYRFHERQLCSTGGRRAAGLIVITACLIVWTSASLWGGEPADGPAIKFLGAARTAAGSAYLIDAGTYRLLIDFGAFPQGKTDQDLSPLPFDPASLDYVFITHAHADHAGRLPLLFRKGFKGRVIGTGATRDLLAITLEGALKIDRERDAAGYGEEEIQKILRHYWAVPYDQEVSVSPQLSFRLRNAGHILGAAMIELWIRGRKGPVKVVATGDMGRSVHVLLPPPAVITDADYILVESTYGPIKRGYEDYRAFGTAIGQTLRSGGSVLIPAFALDRTQKVLEVLGRLKAERVIPTQTPVYVDSPSAQAITQVYRTYNRDLIPPSRQHNLHGANLDFPGLRLVKSRQSLAAHAKRQPAIFVTTSGMLDHGQAPRHLERMIGDKRHLLAIVSFQAPGTLGALLQQGAKTVKIPLASVPGEEGAGAYEEKAVKMRVQTFELFSNHADGCDILTWLSHFPKTKHVLVVHGEEDHALGMVRAIRENLGFSASAPRIGDVYPLSPSAPDRPLASGVQPCHGLPVREARPQPAGH